MGFRDADLLAGLQEGQATPRTRRLHLAHAVSGLAGLESGAEREPPRHGWASFVVR
jgi:hypothetical protein